MPHIVTDDCGLYHWSNNLVSKRPARGKNVFLKFTLQKLLVLFRLRKEKLLKMHQQLLKFQNSFRRFPSMYLCGMKNSPYKAVTSSAPATARISNLKRRPTRVNSFLRCQQIKIKARNRLGHPEN